MDCAKNPGIRTPFRPWVIVTLGHLERQGWVVAASQLRLQSPLVGWPSPNCHVSGPLFLHPDGGQ